MNYPKDILDALPVLATMIDMHTHEILFANRHMKSIFGNVVGKICWQALQKDRPGPCPFCSDKHLVDENGSPLGSYRRNIKNTLTRCWFDTTDTASVMEDGRLVKMSIAIDITEKLNSVPASTPGSPRLEPRSINPEKMVVMCARCQKIRNSSGHWLSPAHYLKLEMGILVSHSVCGGCGQVLYPEFTDTKDEN